MRTLVVGGTGPTGPFIVNGLLERGHQVTIFHRGTHEVPEIPESVEHIHGDPHFRETIDAALEGRTFDVVVATYGRIRLIAEALAGRAGRFLSVGGVAYYRGFSNPRLLRPRGLLNPVAESDAAAQEAEERFGWLIASTEEAVFRHHPTATVFRYPYVYGPYQLIPREWSLVRRILDGRRTLLLPDGGTNLSTHGWAGNLAHALLLAVDRPDASAGKAYNCGDLHQLSVRQVAEVIADALGAEVEFVAVPSEVAGPLKVLTLGGRFHQLMDLSAIQADLGYTDVLPAVEALAHTARWYAANRPEPGGETEQRLDDPFDYAREDRLIEAAAAAMELWQVAAGQPGGPQVPKGFRPHPYAHPKDANAARDHRGR